MKRLIGVLVLAASTCVPGLADTFLYGINCCSKTAQVVPYVYQIDVTTGAITDLYTGLSSVGGSGLAVAGDTLYYTTDNSSGVYSYNLSTKTDNGLLFYVPNSIIGTPWALAYDGIDLYIADQNKNGGNLFKFSLTGELLLSLELEDCYFCDGLTYFTQNGAGYLVASEETVGGPFDLYNLDGTLKQHDFIDAGESYFTGSIAFDGTDFYTSNLDLGSLDVWSETGAYLKTITLTGIPAGYPPSIIGLSVDESPVPPPPDVPEPDTWWLLGTGMAGLLMRSGRGSHRFLHFPTK